MQRYTDSTYGDAFADVYDDWYGSVSDVEATVRLVERLAACAEPLADAERRALEVQHDVRLALEPAVVPGRRARQRRVEQALAVRDDADDDGMAELDRAIAEGAWRSR